MTGSIVKQIASGGGTLSAAASGLQQQQQQHGEVIGGVTGLKALPVSAGPVIHAPRHGHAPVAVTVGVVEVGGSLKFYYNSY